MKLPISGSKDRLIRSPPSRGAWIEITGIPLLRIVVTPSPPSRGAWIEI